MKKAIFLLIALILCSFVTGFTQNSFSDGTTSGNITFTAGIGVYKYITFPFWASLTKAEIDLKNYNDVEDVLNMTRNYGAYTGGYCNYNTTRGSPFMLTSPALITTVNIYGRYYPSIGNTTVEIRNGTLSTWGDKIYSQANFTNLGNNVGTWYNVSMPPTGIEANKIYWIVSNCSGSCPSATCISYNDSNPLASMFSETYQTHYTTSTSYGDFTNASLIYFFNSSARNMYTNLAIRTDNEITYQNTTFNGTVSNIDLNKTSLQTCINNKIDKIISNPVLYTDDTSTSVNAYGTDYNNYIAYDFTSPTTGYLKLTLQLSRSNTDYSACPYYYVQIKDSSMNNIDNQSIYMPSLPTSGSYTSLNFSFYNQPLVRGTKYYISFTAINSSCPSSKSLFFRVRTDLGLGIAYLSTNHGPWTVVTDAYRIFNRLFFDLDYDVICPINFTSASAGILEYSGIEITYTNLTATIIFKDEETDLVITNRNVSFDVITDTNSYNYTTDDGNLTIYGLTTGEYTFRYSAPDYVERFYFGDITNHSPTITLYLVNSSTAETITASVYDQNNNLLEGVYILSQKYYLSDNAYKLVEVSKTNFEGETKLHLIRNKEYYKFLLYYPISTLRQTTTPTYVYDTSIVFQISTSDSIAIDYLSSVGVGSLLTFNNNTNLFTWVFSDTSGTITQGCMQIQKIDIKGFNNTVNSSCVASNSGTINLGVNRENGTTYTAHTYVTIDGEDWFVDGKSYSYPDLPDSSPDLMMGLLIDLVMTIAFCFSFKHSIELGIVAVPLPTLFLSIMGILEISIPVAVGIEIAAVILAIILNRVIE